MMEQHRLQRTLRMGRNRDLHRERKSWRFGAGFRTSRFSGAIWLCQANKGCRYRPIIRSFLWITEDTLREASKEKP